MAAFRGGVKRLADDFSFLLAARGKEEVSFCPG
jgi:hypothetical protein